MEAGTFVSPWLHYDTVAEYCAKRGIPSALLLRALITATPECWELIDEDPEAFEQRIKDFAYGIHMEALGLPEL